MTKIPDDVPLIYGLRNHPDEARLVGLMLMGYSEIEFRMFSLFKHVIGDEDRAFKMFYRNRSEGIRIDLYDAACRPEMKNLRLDGQFGHALGAIKHCHKMRNQYAHCTWSGEKPLLLLNLGESSKKAEPVTHNLKGRLINLKLLEQQHMYFVTTLLWASHLPAGRRLLYPIQLALSSI